MLLLKSEPPHIMIDSFPHCLLISDLWWTTRLSMKVNLKQTLICPIGSAKQWTLPQDHPPNLILTELLSNIKSQDKTPKQNSHPISLWLTNSQALNQTSAVSTRAKYPTQISTKSQPDLWNSKQNRNLWFLNQTRSKGTKFLSLWKPVVFHQSNNAVWW